MIATYDTIKKKIAKGTLASCYFLQGTQPYYIEKIIHALQEKIAPEGDNHHANLFTYYGREKRLQEIITHARQLPMMAQNQLIIIKEAQEMEALNRSKEREPLIRYLASPNPHTHLVFAYKGKKIQEQDLIAALKSPQHLLYTTPTMRERELIPWIANYLKERNHTITPTATSLLILLLGNDLQKVAQELDRIAITHPANRPITRETIASEVGSQREINLYDLQKAIAHKEAERTAHLLTYFLSDTKMKSIIPLIALLTTFFLKLLRYQALAAHYHPTEVANQIGIPIYFLKDYQKAAQKHSPEATLRHIQALHQADLQVKGIASTLPEDVILEELIAKLLL